MLERRPMTARSSGVFRSAPSGWRMRYVGASLFFVLSGFILSYNYYLRDGAIIDRGRSWGSRFGVVLTCRWLAAQAAASLCAL